jgi:hypothetical protein
MALTHTYITKDGMKTDQSFTRGKAIRQKCLDCSCWQEAEIRRCTAQDCALYPFRMGNISRGLETNNLTATEKI